MEFLDYFKYITVEDLIEKRFLKQDDILKTNYGYLMNIGCGYNSSPQIIYMPFNDFRIFICPNSSCLYYQSFSYSDYGNNETDKLMLDYKKNIKKQHDILDFIVHSERCIYLSRGEAALFLIKNFQIDIPAEVIKKYFLSKMLC